jgi:hypothetical protein
MRPFEPGGSEREVQQRRVLRYLALAVLLLGPLVLAGCEEQTTGVPITGLDHLSVSQFYVDGYSAFQAGTGGSTVCCAVLPKRWRPDLTVEIRWNVTNWRDCDGNDYVRRVPVERYDQVGALYVHFLADGNVRVVSSNYWPEASRYPGPHDPIPSKRPWNIYPLDAICKAKKGAKPGAGASP